MKKLVLVTLMAAVAVPTVAAPVAANAQAYGRHDDTPGPPRRSSG